MILLYKYFFIAGYLLTAVQNIKESEFYYVVDDQNVIHKVYTSDPVNETLVQEATKNDYNIYSLYTRKNTNTEEILVYEDKESIRRSAFDVDKVTVFVTHGWTGDGKSEVITTLTKAFLQNGDVNVVAVDWGKVSKSLYHNAVAAVPAVGRHVGKFINWLTTLGVSYKKVHVVGFSLGAHVVGNAGKATKSKIRRITGLDPAGPMWEESRDRLDKTNAQYVEIIHTNMKCWGHADLLGHADFFPNGGQNMPDCYLSACSHRKAYHYMVNSILDNNMNAQECSSMKEVESDSCKGKRYLMGNADLTKSRSGIFRWNTEQAVSSPKFMEAIKTYINIAKNYVQKCWFEEKHDELRTHP